LIYSFVVDHADIEEIKAHTKEVFANLFIARQPSMEAEVGYEIKGDVIIMKYEQNEDDRIVLDSEKRLKEMGSFLPPIFGAVLEIHRIDKLQICDRIYDVEVYVNQPAGMYANERSEDGQVIRHELGGLFYERCGNVYRQIDDPNALLKMQELRRLNLGPFISPAHLVRFEVGDKFVYTPVGYCFHDPLVSKALCPAIKVAQWAEKTAEINDYLDGLNSF